ncbi:MAG: V-type ATP synthase subunit F [Anaerococcus sp.]|nr:V-type ATP synthase subunit F [Anaerococcus sp.]
MKAKLISKDPSLSLIFRLGGIDSVRVESSEESDKEFTKAIEDPNLGLLILTRDIYGNITKEVDQYRAKTSKPLIVVIDG